MSRSNIRQEAIKQAVIYIHVPFCISLGPCVPLGSVVADTQTKHRYMRALRQEIEGALPLMEEYEIPAIYVGGASPSIMSPDDVCSLLQYVRRSAPLTRGFELSMKVLPQTVGTPSMEGMKAGGVNRLCLSMVSALDEELSSLGCGFALGDIDTVMSYVVQFDFRNVDIAVFRAFPGQTQRSFCRTLRTASAFAPSHVTIEDFEERSLPGLESTGARTAGMPPTDARTNARATSVLSDEARQILGAAGYRQYAECSFAKPGKESRYLLLRDGGCDYFGFGVGARSLIDGIVCTNTTDLGTYIDNAASYDRIVANVERLSPKQRQHYLDAMRTRLRRPATP